MQMTEFSTEQLIDLYAQIGRELNNRNSPHITRGLTQFVRDHCIIDTAARILKWELRDAYVKWSVSENLTPVSTKEIGRYLHTLPGIRVGGNGGNSYYGIKLRDTP